MNYNLYYIWVYARNSRKQSSTWNVFDNLSNICYYKCNSKAQNKVNNMDSNDWSIHGM